MIVGWEWMWRRTKRLANLLAEPQILAGALQLVQALDNWCAANGVPEKSVQLGDAIFVRGLDYIEYPLVSE